MALPDNRGVAALDNAQDLGQIAPCLRERTLHCCRTRHCGDAIALPSNP